MASEGCRFRTLLSSLILAIKHITVNTVHRRNGAKTQLNISSAYMEGEMEHSMSSVCNYDTETEDLKSSALIGIRKMTKVRCGRSQVSIGMRRREAVSIWLLVLLALMPGLASAVRSVSKPGSFKLHYTTAGTLMDDGSRQMPGLYSGRLLSTGLGSPGPSVNSSFEDLRGLDFGCAQVDNEVLSGLHIQGVSFDDDTQEVLIVEDNLGRLDLLHGHLCNIQRKPCLGTPEWKKLSCILCEIETSGEGLLGPFAIHSHTVYFIYIPDHVDHHSQLKHHKVIQLRMLTGCEYPIYNRLEVNVCSTVLATYTSSSHHMQAASDLTIMELGDSLMFLTQARTYDWDNPARTSFAHVGMILVGFHKVGRKAGFRVHQLHSDNLPLRYLDLSLANIGGIGVYMMTVCWSVFDRIHCGRMNENGRNIVNKTVVVQPGDASSVCEGEKHNMTTGVAIVDANKVKQVTLIFGCTAQRMGEGGVGLAHMQVNKNREVEISIEQVVDKYGPVTSGSLFITRKTMCTTNNTPTGQTHVHWHGAGASQSSLNFFMLAAVLLKFLYV